MRTDAKLAAVVQLLAVGLVRSRSLTVLDGVAAGVSSGLPAGVPRVPTGVSGAVWRGVSEGVPPAVLGASSEAPSGLLAGESSSRVPDGVSDDVWSSLSGRELHRVPMSAERGGVLSEYGVSSAAASGVSATSVGVLQPSVADVTSSVLVSSQHSSPALAPSGLTSPHPSPQLTSISANQGRSHKPPDTSEDVSPETSEHVSAENAGAETKDTSGDAHDPDSDMSDVDDIADPEEDAEIIDTTANITSAKTHAALILPSPPAHQSVTTAGDDVINTPADATADVTPVSADVPAPFLVYDRRLTGSRSLFPQRRRRRPTRLRLWPDGVIPYSISSNYSSSERRLIDRVFRLFETVTCLRLVPRTFEKDYVRITPAGRCSGEVGRRGGRQRISLPHWCLSFSHAAHELMHTAGFWHEHQRPDRDKYVRVLWDNIKPRHRRADYGLRVWEELGEGSWLGPYDYHSILHYSGRGSAVDRSKPTMVARQDGIKLGGSGNLTDIDVWKINTQYHCWQRGQNALFEFEDQSPGGRWGRDFDHNVVEQESPRKSTATSADRNEATGKLGGQRHRTTAFTGKTKSVAQLLDTIKELVEHKGTKLSSAKVQHMGDSSASDKTNGGEPNSGGKTNVQTVELALSKRAQRKSIETSSFIKEDKSSQPVHEKKIEIFEKEKVAFVGTKGKISAKPKQNNLPYDLKKIVAASNEQARSSPKQETSSNQRKPSISGTPEMTTKSPDKLKYLRNIASLRVPESLDNETWTSNATKETAQPRKEDVAAPPKENNTKESSATPRRKTTSPEKLKTSSPSGVTKGRVRVVIKLKDLVKPTISPPPSPAHPGSGQVPPSDGMSLRRREFDRVVVSLSDLQRLRRNRQPPLARRVQQHQRHPQEHLQTPSTDSFQRNQRHLGVGVQHDAQVSTARPTADKDNPFSHIGGFRVGDRWFFSRVPARRQPDPVVVTTGADSGNPFRSIGGFRVDNDWLFFGGVRRARRQLTG